MSARRPTTRTILALTAIILLLAAPLHAADTDAILGAWLMDTGKHKARLEITKQGDTYEGRITWLEQPTYPGNDRRGMAGKAKVDRENPDPTLRSRPLVGLKILTGATYAGNGEWRDGHIYAPDSGKSYRWKARLTEDGVLKVRGYVGISILGHGMDWTRLDTESSDDRHQETQ